MTTITTMLVQSMVLGGGKSGQTKQTESSGDLFKGLIANKLTTAPLSAEGLSEEQTKLLQHLEQFRQEYNEENGSDLNLHDLIQQLKSDLASFGDILPLLREFDRILPTPTPMGVHAQDADRLQAPIVNNNGKETSLSSLLNMMKTNGTGGNTLQEFVKFLSQTNVGKQLPQLQNLKHMLTQLQSKNQQNIIPDVGVKDSKSAATHQHQQPVFLHMREQYMRPKAEGVVDSKSIKLHSGDVANASGLFTATSPSLMSRVEQLVIHAPQENESTARFVNDMAKMMNRGRLMTLPNGSTQMSIKLFPENLGALDIQIIQRNGEIAAKIIASSAQAKELIETNLNQLRHVLQGQNITVNQIEVSSHVPDWMNDEREKQNQQSSPDSQQQEEQDEDESGPQSFQQWMEELEVEEEV
jgi:flagellar hook-length control protein FliK